MSTPRHPDQDDALPLRRALSWKVIGAMSAVATLLVAVIALHVAGVFGP